METNEKTNNILKRIVNIFSWVVVAFAIGIMIFTIVSVNTLDKTDSGLFGHKFYIVQTGSMSKSDKNADMKIHFNAGDVIIVKEISLDAQKELDSGDVIAFISTNPGSEGETITHMIRERKYEDGKFVGYVTFGTNTDTNDDATVEPGYILGVYSGKIPYLGHFFAFLRTVPGYLLCILLPFALIIGSNAISAVRAFRAYKGEQHAELANERAELAKEREETAKMMKELMELKAQLGLGTQTTAGKTDDTQDDQE